MECSKCQSTHIRKNGTNEGSTHHICVDCRRQFVECPKSTKGYSNEVKQEYLKMIVNGIHHTTLITWASPVGEQLPDTYAPETILAVGELDELETFIGSKKTKSGFGQQLTTSNNGSWGGWSETIVLGHLNHYGQRWRLGSATSMSPMAGPSIRALFAVISGGSFPQKNSPEGDQSISKTHSAWGGKHPIALLSRPIASQLNSASSSRNPLVYKTVPDSFPSHGSSVNWHIVM